MNRTKQKQIIYSPLLGYRGLIYDTRENANFFADTLEESFKENKAPYSNTHIAKINRAVRNNSVIPPSHYHHSPPQGKSAKLSSVSKTKELQERTTSKI
ncbi:hypothetical protein TNIN_153931 [Trichonephila inaurata madagascariensis]|uniref:Uncharacterized protein n=1 Tax=Trichonephila inaurata madagascariensis TaxID=2747483 RepID=A0A8X6XYL5_9ARAC|nr:hypothetical protein TNIN_153931 [Trichonephila inaurata madagascariensis]